MTKLIIIIVIGIIISQITAAIRRKQEEARRGGQGIPKIGPTIEVALDYLEEKRVKVNKQPTLRMETREKPIIRTLESEEDDEEAFDEKQGSSYKTKANPPKPQVTPKLEVIPQKPPIVSFAPKSILQGIVISEILKRPRY